MKQFVSRLILALGLTLTIPAADVAARDSDSDSDSGSDSGWTPGGGSESGPSRGVPELDPGVAGGALVLLLGGVAYLASRRRDRT